MGEVVEQEAVRAARQRRAGAENSDQSEPAPPRRYAAEPIALFDMGNNESEEDQEEWYDAAEVEENDQSDQAGPHVRYGGVQGVRQVPAGHRLAVAPSQEPADQLQYVGHLQDENLAEAGRMQQDGEVEGELKKLHHPGHPAHPAAPRGYGGEVHRPAQLGEVNKPADLQGLRNQQVIQRGGEGEREQGGLGYEGGQQAKQHVRGEPGQQLHHRLVRAGGEGRGDPAGAGQHRGPARDQLQRPPEQQQGDPGVEMVLKEGRILGVQQDQTGGGRAAQNTYSDSGYSTTRDGVNCSDPGQDQGYRQSHTQQQIHHRVRDNLPRPQLRPQPELCCSISELQQEIKISNLEQKIEKLEQENKNLREEREDNKYRIHAAKFVQKLHLDDMKKNKYGNNGDINSWIENAKNILYLLQVPTNLQPRLVLSWTSGKAAEIISSLHSAEEMFDALHKHFDAKEDRLKELAEQHQELGRIYGEEHYKEKEGSYERGLAERERIIRKHLEIAKEAEKLLEKEEPQAMEDLLQPIYIKHLRHIFPKPTFPSANKTEPISCFNERINLLKKLAEDAIDDKKDVPPGLKGDDGDERYRKSNLTWQERKESRGKEEEKKKEEEKENDPNGKKYCSECGATRGRTTRIQDFKKIHDKCGENN